MKSHVLRLAAASLLAFAIHSKASAIPVGLELILLTDVSGSVDNSEYALQKGGYVSAFKSASVQNAILGSTGGSIAVTYIEWSGASQQSIQVGWTLIDSVASAIAFADAIDATTRSFANLTAPGSALNFATPLFSSNNYDAPRQVIDVSGDGSQNDGANTPTARNAALAAGVDAINGLPILGSEGGLEAWYVANIQGGTGSFTLAADSFADFAAAIESKLVREIRQGVPDGGSTLVMALGVMVGLASFRRRKI